MGEFFNSVQFILNNYSGLLIKGTGVTILLAIVGTGVGFLIGLLIGIYKTIPIREDDSAVKKVLYKVFNFLLSAYIEVFRSTPMMVQASVIFYGSAWIFGLRLNPVTAGMFIISINTGAYMAEIVRGGMLTQKVIGLKRLTKPHTRAATIQKLPRQTKQLLVPIMLTTQMHYSL